jgi:hypothetical protein
MLSRSERLKRLSRMEPSLRWLFNLLIFRRDPPW